MAQQPEPLIDYVARFTHPNRRMHTRVIRAASMHDALETIEFWLQGSDWTLMDVVTAEESAQRALGTTSVRLGYGRTNP